MITRNFNLYLNAGHSVPLVINVNQYDQGEQWIFTLYNSDGTQYTPSTGAIVGIKSDGLGIINSGSVVDGNVVINETQQMTAAVGKAVFELTIDSGTHGTANFVVLVEEKPGNNADLSDSDLSLIQEALDAVNPLPTGGSVGQVLTKTANGSTWSDAGTPTQEQVADAVSDWADEHITVTTGVVIDTSLAVAGAAADSKKVGDEITDLKSAISGGGLTSTIKSALMNVVDHIGAWTDGNAQVYIEGLRTALYPPATLIGISAAYTQSGTVYDNDSLDVLRNDLVVTASYDNGTTAPIIGYTLSGTLTEGTSTITASFGGFTATFTVTVTHYIEGLIPVQDGLVTYFDLRTAEYDNQVVGNKTFIYSSDGNYSTFAWAKDCVTGQDAQMGLQMNARWAALSSVKDGTTQMKSSETWTQVILTYKQLPAVTGVTYNNVAGMALSASYTNTGGTIASTTSTPVNVGYRGGNEMYMPLVIRASAEKFDFFDTTGEVIHSVNASDISDFASWIVNLGFGLGSGSNGYCTYYAVYNRALTDSEVYRVIDYLATLEVTA